jgi:oxygen-independent coproporphyrinogen-3 oxidase
MLYLHIPFCKQACSYCNFHFSTNLKPRRAVLDALENELRFRRHELPSGPVPSIYFGGGTPSLLTAEELDRIFGVLVEMEYLGRQRAGAKDNGEEQTFPEITLEANPDDLDQATIDMLAASPVNRLSIGVQSFFEEDLRFMNRAHNAEEARRAIDATVAAGFHNSSIDLIYGGQTTSDEMWAENLRIAADLGVHHISSYALTVEPKTALGHQVAAGKVADTDDDKFSRHFDMLIDGLTAAGYEHYEISNFCLPGQQSRHNSGYWSGQAYLGVGPGAHSFDGQRRRRWNVANNNRYAKLWAGHRFLRGLRRRRWSALRTRIPHRH